MAESPLYAHCKSDLHQAARDLESLRDELSKEQARLEWLLPRQFNHKTREDVDRELRIERALKEDELRFLEAHRL